MAEIKSINVKELSDNYARNQLLSKIDKNKLNDNGTGVDELWSANKLNTQFNTVTKKTETQLLQNQVNNLVLGAVGDGNNAEVVASRGEFDLLPNRLDDFDVRTESIINQRNILNDKSIRYKSWGVVNGDYSIISGSNFSNAIKIINQSVKISIFKDIEISKIVSGDYIFNFRCSNDVEKNNLYATISVIGYPTEVNSGGTVLFTKPDFKVWDSTLNEGYQEKEIKFSIATENYNHCRFIIECRTLTNPYIFTDLYLGVENSACNKFSYIDYKFNSIEKELSYIKTITTSKLYNKTLYLDGDSITFGAGYEGGYGKILSDKYGCINTNNAVSGSTLVSGTTYSDGSPRHHIAESVIANVNKQYDYMILSGGFNDYGNNVPIGELSTSEFCFTNPVTTDNVIGALETIFRHVLRNYPITKIYFLITHKINRINAKNTLNLTLYDYVIAIKSVCERYSIPIINIWENSRMVTVYDNIANTYTLNGDRVHPNFLGYNEFYIPTIEKELGL